MSIPGRMQASTTVRCQHDSEYSPLRTAAGAGMTHPDSVRRKHGFSNKHSVLLIDGPLKGAVVTVMPDSATYRAHDPSDFENILEYRITQIGFHHGGTAVLLRIASIDIPNWSAEDLAEAMLNDTAKQALITHRPDSRLRAFSGTAERD